MLHTPCDALCATRLKLLTIGSCEGAALLVIMSITDASFTGPRETNGYRELKPLSAGFNLELEKITKKSNNKLYHVMHCASYHVRFASPPHHSIMIISESTTHPSSGTRP